MTKVRVPTGATVNTTSKNAPTRTVDAGGVRFAYRELGPQTGVPLVFLHHLTAILDDWDPRVTTSHSEDLARRIPGAELIIYPNPGHGGVFQYHREFVPAVLEFLESSA
jgi:pimeloyl-ACP methyl ester carboxylesterase